MYVRLEAALLGTAAINIQVNFTTIR